MNKEEADRILERYLAGEASAAETALIERWYQNTADERRLSEADSFEGLGEELWLGTKTRAGLTPSKMPVRKLWPRIVAAASVVFILGISLWFYRAELFGGRPELVIAINDAAPGQQQTTLSLANGKTISLSSAKAGVVVSSGQLSYNDGSSLNAVDPELNTAARVQLTAATPRGGTYQVTLPDGTRVWLNAASRLSFPSKFNDTARRVELSGEAYFEVARLQRQVSSSRRAVPFIVAARNQEVEVLGTHFNISSYPDENTSRTTLLEGSVRVKYTLPGKQKPVVLKPGQQAVAGTGTGIQVTEADLELATAWKSGLFYFKDADLKQILRTFSRWYDIDVISTTLPGDRKFSGKLYRNMEATQALQVLKLLEVDLSLEKGRPKAPRQIIVKP